MKFLKDFKLFLSGKKAYIVGILMVALGLMTDNLDMVMQGLVVITGRAAIAKI